MPRPEGEKNDDEFLVRQLVQGNEKAFQKLFEKYKDDIFTYSKSLLQSDAAAEEIVQEVFLRLWKNSDGLDPKLSLRSYIFTIAKNLSFDFLRKAANNRKLQEEIFYLTNEAQDILQEALLNTDYEILKKKAIDLLPPKRRKIFEMSRNEGMSYKEISTELGISVSTVKTQMSKALFTLKKYLQLNTDFTFLSGFWAGIFYLI